MRIYRRVYRVWDIDGFVGEYTTHLAALNCARSLCWGRIVAYTVDGDGRYHWVNEETV